MNKIKEAFKKMNIGKAVEIHSTEVLKNYEDYVIIWLSFSRRCMRNG